jgi:8-oxo-dGTP pyrophosphatase MutT (NUDIX family)
MAQQPYLSLVKPWEVGPSTQVAKNRIFSLNERRNTSPAGKAATFVYLDSADWCNVIALTPSRRVVMIEQFRHGIERVTLEIPGGIIDKGESPAAACVRELSEETGYAGEPCRLIGTVSANPAIQNNWVHTGVVLNAARAGVTHQDEHEDIAVRLVDLREIPSLIRQGLIHHSYVVAAFYHLHAAGL